MGIALHRKPKVRKYDAPVIYKQLTQERVETMHRKCTKYILIFSFGFDHLLARLSQTRSKSIMKKSGSSPTFEALDKILRCATVTIQTKPYLKFFELILLVFWVFTQKSLDFAQFPSLPILPRVKMSKRQAMDIQHSLLTLLLLVVRSNLSKEINLLLILDRRPVALLFLHDDGDGYENVT